MSPPSCMPGAAEAGWLEHVPLALSLTYPWNWPHAPCQLVVLDPGDGWCRRGCGLVARQANEAVHLVWTAATVVAFMPSPGTSCRPMVGGGSSSTGDLGACSEAEAAL